MSNYLHYYAQDGVTLDVQKVFFSMANTMWILLVHVNQILEFDASAFI